MGIPSETGDIPVTVWVIVDVYSISVLGGDGLVACDVIVMLLVREVEQQIVGASRVYCKLHDVFIFMYQV